MYIQREQYDERNALPWLSHNSQLDLSNIGSQISITFCDLFVTNWKLVADLSVTRLMTECFFFLKIMTVCHIRLFLSCNWAVTKSITKMWQSCRLICDGTYGQSRFSNKICPLLISDRNFNLHSVTKFYHQWQIYIQVFLINLLRTTNFVTIDLLATRHSVTVLILS